MKQCPKGWIHLDHYTESPCTILKFSVCYMFLESKRKKKNLELIYLQQHLNREHWKLLASRRLQSNHRATYYLRLHRNMCYCLKKKEASRAYQWLQPVAELFDQYEFLSHNNSNKLYRHQRYNHSPTSMMSFGQ